MCTGICGHVFLYSNVSRLLYRFNNITEICGQKCVCVRVREREREEVGTIKHTMTYMYEISGDLMITMNTLDILNFDPF